MMDNVIEKAVAAIEAQQAKLDKYHPAHMVGQQLKDIIKTSPAAASLVLMDLTQKGMGLTDCEKKIDDFAHAHKVGNKGCCPPDEADKIIRQFYGISTTNEQQVAPTAQREPDSDFKVVSLFDKLAEFENS
jgi:hypothetical protein